MLPSIESRYSRSRMIARAICILGLVAFVPTAAHAEDGLDPAAHEAVRDIGRALTEGALEAIGVRPPAPQVVHVPIDTRPSESAVWVPGYWRWNPGPREYRWVDGLWREPPTDMKWHPGEWRQTDSGWFWMRGYWAPAKIDVLIRVPEPPPPPRIEVRLPRPGEGFVWVPGRWSYEDGRFRWTSGSWQKLPSPDRVWVEGSWIRMLDGFRYLPGYWDHPKKARVRDGLPPGHGGIPPGHGGTPPGQAKKGAVGKGPKGVPPGHR